MYSQTWSIRILSIATTWSIRALWGPPNQFSTTFTCLIQSPAQCNLQPPKISPKCILDLFNATTTVKCDTLQYHTFNTNMLPFLKIWMFMNDFSFFYIIFVSLPAIVLTFLLKQSKFWYVIIPRCSPVYFQITCSMWSLLVGPKGGCIEQVWLYIYRLCNSKINHWYQAYLQISVLPFWWSHSVPTLPYSASI